jgi:hypothetical protein
MKGGKDLCKMNLPETIIQDDEFWKPRERERDAETNENYVKIIQNSTDKEYTIYNPSANMGVVKQTRKLHIRISCAWKTSHIPLRRMIHTIPELYTIL